MGGTRTVPDESRHTYTNFALLFLSFSGDGYWPFRGVAHWCFSSEELRTRWRDESHLDLY